MMVKEKLAVYGANGVSMEYSRESCIWGTDTEKSDCKLPSTSFKEIMDSAMEYMNSRDMN